MKRWIVLAVAMASFVVFLASLTTSQAEPMTNGTTEIAQPNPLDEPFSSADVFPPGVLVGSPQWTGLRRLIGSRVLSAHGDTLGWVDHFVFDPQGQAAFAIVSSSGAFGIHKKMIPVPWSAIMSSSFVAGDRLILRMEREEFASAPSFSNIELRSQRWVEKAYRFFGQNPAWSEPSETRTKP